MSREDLESAWQSFLNEQESKARGLPTLEPAALGAELASVQILLGFMNPVALDEVPAQPPQLEQSRPEPESAAGAAEPPPCTKKKGHGRNRVPPTMREETIIIEPDEIPEGARLIGTETAIRVGIQRAQVVRYVVVRPKYGVISGGIVFDPILAG